MKSTDAVTLTTSSDRKIAMTRVFDAPSNLVSSSSTSPPQVLVNLVLDGGA